jgi:hypothetical protein
MTETIEQPAAQPPAIAELPSAPAPAKPPSLEAGAHIAPIIPRTVEEVGRIARAVIVAGLAPNSYEGRTDQETVSKIMIGIMKGAEVGLPPITALSTIAIINNRPCIWGDGAVALVQSRGVVESVETHYVGEEGRDDYAAVYRIWRRGQSVPYEGRFSIGDAKRAGLWNHPKKQPWMLYPTRMLMMRARAYALRDGFADCLAGLSVAEEAQDIPAPPRPVETGFLDDEAPPKQIEAAATEPKEAA